MQQLLVLGLVGLLAQLVDGSLGMGYGVTSSSLLLAAGLSPVAASASVHLAEVMTTAASAVAHWRFGNVDRRLFMGLILPGAAGAFAGAYLLTSIPAAKAAPAVAAFLFLLGCYVLLRYLAANGTSPAPGGMRQMSRPFLAGLGLLAGFVDASGGGGWGPIVTPALILQRGVEPRRAVGSSDSSEFFVAFSASLGFILGLSGRMVDWKWVLALAGGGLLAAPLAAWLVRWLPAKLLGLLVGSIIILTNLRTLLLAGGLAGDARRMVYMLAGLTLASVVAYGWWASRGTSVDARRAEPASLPQGEG